MVHVLASVLHMNLSACVYRQSFWHNPQTAVSDYSLEGWAHRPCEFTPFAMPTVKLPRPPTKQSKVREKCGSAKQIQLFHTSDSKQHLYSDFNMYQHSITTMAQGDTDFHRFPRC